jgi:hypothetical protein
MLNFYVIFTIFNGKLNISNVTIDLSELIGYLKDFTVIGKTACLWKSTPGKAGRLMNFDKSS